MNNEKLKNRSAIPFETLGVAIAFSPRLEAVLCEAKRLQDLFRAHLVLIHVGKHSDEKERDLSVLMKQCGFDESRCKTVWEDGHPVDVILKICKENVVDLLIAGAVEKESFLRFYIGSVSREICRKAKCAVLMLIEPSMTGTKFRKIVVNGVEHPKTKNTLAAALYFARHEQSESMTLVRELHLTAMAMSTVETLSDPEQMKNELMDSETEKLNELLQTIDTSGISSGVKTVIGKTGYAIANYTKEQQADLLVINSPDHHLNILDRLFTHDIEFILADLPTNLLIVHSRVENEMKKISY